MSRSDKAIEQIIAQAMREGKFNKLRGEGEPLKLMNNPHVNEGWQLAFDMMSNNGFAPPWVETRIAIENQLRSAREKMARTWIWAHKLEDGDNDWTQDTIDGELAKAQTLFESQIGDINKKIRSYNLETPSDKFQRLPINVAKEVEQIIKSKL